MIWICPKCGLTNEGVECSGCGSPSPDYNHHVQILNLGRGPVFNGTVNVAVMPPDEALTEFYGKEILNSLEERPTSWEQFTDFLIKVMFWGSVCVIGFIIVFSILVLLTAFFG